jgi:putative transposase
MKAKKGRGYVYNIQYHIVWCVKDRHKVLTGVIEHRLKEMIYEISKEHGFGIAAMETDQDHIHILIDCRPQHYIPSLIKGLKGNTARFLFKEFPELRKKLWGGHLWNPSYFVGTVSENTKEQIESYINSQKAKGA